MRTLCLLLALTAPLLAQGPAKPGAAKAGAAKGAATPAPVAPPAGSAAPVIDPASGLVVNGTFAKTRPVDNLWDGVNSTNGLAGEVRSAYAITERGAPGAVALPVSVNFIDMNGDGLNDIVSADPAGTMRVYFNSGSKTDPKFTVAETVPLFLSRPAKDEEFDYWWGHGMAKIAMYDWNKSGSVDLLFGNYSGEIVFIPNAGTKGSPYFPQPPVYARATIPTSKKGHLWANLLAPCVYDWNKDGKPDVLTGEGSYSANAIHLLINEGANIGGKFTDESRYFLCFGDGREHLVPTVVDWNADGEPDVLVGDRNGTVSVHLREPTWRPGDELKMYQYVDFAGTQKLGIAITPTAVDYNGDGLFDILLGRADGRIQLSLNRGEKGQPKFDKPADVLGTDLWGKNILVPEGWTTDNANYRGNIYGFVTVTDEASPGGGKVLKMGYWPSPNKIIKLVHPTVAGRNNDYYWRNDVGIWYPLDATRGGEFKPVNAFTIRQNLKGIKNNGTYTISFKARGNKMTDGLATVALFGHVELAPTRFERKSSGRGANAIRNELTDEVMVRQELRNGDKWETYSKTFTVTFNKKELKATPEPKFAILEFKAFLAQYDGTCEVADVSIKEGK